MPWAGAVKNSKDFKITYLYIIYEHKNIKYLNVCSMYV